MRIRVVREVAWWVSRIAALLVIGTWLFLVALLVGHELLTIVYGTSDFGFWMYGDPWSLNWGFRFFDVGVELKGSFGFFSCMDQC